MVWVFKALKEKKYLWLVAQNISSKIDCYSLASHLDWLTSNIYDSSKVYNPTFPLDGWGMTNISTNPYVAKSDNTCISNEPFELPTLTLRPTLH
jgi:hypothetical protein